MTDDKKLFLEHLQELKIRLLYYLLWLTLASIVSYFYYPHILNFLLRPLEQPLYYSSPAGGFDLVFKVTVLTGFLLTIPVLIYQIFKFVSPLLPTAKQQMIIGYIVVSSILMLLGISFAYFISLPAAIRFFAGFGSDQLHSLISTRDYFSFLARYLIGFGLLFQVPLVLLVINAIHRLSAQRLMGYGRLVILISFLLSAIITPTPDIVNQAIMAGPIIFLYYGSVGLIKIINYPE